MANRRQQTKLRKMIVNRHEGRIQRLKLCLHCVEEHQRKCQHQDEDDSAKMLLYARALWCYRRALRDIKKQLEMMQNTFPTEKERDQWKNWLCHHGVAEYARQSDLYRLCPDCGFALEHVVLCQHHELALPEMAGKDLL